MADLSVLLDMEKRDLYSLDETFSFKKNGKLVYGKNGSVQGKKDAFIYMPEGENQHYVLNARLDMKLDDKPVEQDCKYPLENESTLTVEDHVFRYFKGESAETECKKHMFRSMMEDPFYEELFNAAKEAREFASTEASEELAQDAYVTRLKKVLGGNENRNARLFLHPQTQGILMQSECLKGFLQELIGLTEEQAYEMWAEK